MKKLPDFEIWGPIWQKNGWNNCLLHAAEALEYLSTNDRPIGGEQTYNAIDLDSTAYDIRRTLEAFEEHRIKNLEIVQKAIDRYEAKD